MFKILKNKTYRKGIKLKRLLTLVSTCIILSSCNGSSNDSQNDIPTVSAGLAQTVDEQSTVTLSGTAKDNDGTISSYTWAQSSGTSVSISKVNEAKTTFIAPNINKNETLTFTLTVVDNNGAKAVSETEIHVLFINIPPVANAGQDISVLEKKEVTLTGQGSDEDGAIVSYQWIQVSGDTVVLDKENTAEVSFVSPEISSNDTLVFELTVTDNDGAHHSDSIKVSVNSKVGIPFVRPVNSTCKAISRPELTLNVKFINAYPNMKFESFIQTFRMPNNSEYWYMLSQTGHLWRFKDNYDVSEKELLLDISEKVTLRSGEEGFLTMSFHPDFEKNQKVYLYYSSEESGSHFTRLAEYTYDLSAGTLINEVELLRIPQASVNHKGAHLLFGTDGYLYLSVGDDGFIYKDGRIEASQDMSRLNGKLIRINVPGNGTYTIPEDNPFLTAEKPEIYALGFRNPWRFSIDKETGDIFGGDVGANSWEEVNKIEKGGNYGWPHKEGSNCHIEGCEEIDDLIDPVFEYGHDVGFAIIGGHIYRGNAIPALKGKYIYADFASFSQIWVLDYDEKGVAFSTPLLAKALGVGGIRSFTEDHDGEILVNHYSGVFRMVPDESDKQEVTFPEKLSETGCFDAATLEVAQGVLPYDVSSALYTDSADKKRWMAIPDGKNIALDSDGDFVFPDGSVLIKEFSLLGKKIETRLLMLDDNEWSGYTYHWNDEQTDALLLASGKSVPADGFDYKIPSRSQCLQCHNTSGSFAIGPETIQLKSNFTYEENNETNIQMDALNHMGYFTEDVSEKVKGIIAVPNYKDDTLSDEVRVASYLHSNCAYCHNPTGPARGSLDFRWNKTPKWNACNKLPEISSLGIEDARLIYPGDPEKSIIYRRINTVGLAMMPPIGRSTIDSEFVEILERYISHETCE